MLTLLKLMSTEPSFWPTFHLLMTQCQCGDAERILKVQWEVYSCVGGGAEEGAAFATIHVFFQESLTVSEGILLEELPVLVGASIALMKRHDQSN